MTAWQRTQGWSPSRSSISNCSAPHPEATGITDRKTGEVKRAGRVTAEMMRAWVDRAGIELRGAGLDESPDRYKRLDEVLDAVRGTVRILHRLTPVGVAMAGVNEFDPYKD